MRNIVFISADDMSYMSLGKSGCEFSDITPNIDALGEQGVFFKNAHTTVGLCQPSRSVWMTGLYPWNNGALGFNCVRNEVTTLINILKNKGYCTGIIGKSEHLCPEHKFNWSCDIKGYDPLTGYGKNIGAFYNFSKAFFQSAPTPFFYMVNSHYPHRPFEQKTRYDRRKVKVPEFLPDYPETRLEMAQYYEGVTRCDMTVGEIIRALKETGRFDNTLIIFTSDHGMSFPFFKAHCYHFSSKVPLVWFCPDALDPRIIESHIPSVDLMPTLMDFLGLPKHEMDGKSYIETLKSGKEFENNIYSCLCHLWEHRVFQTRAIHNSNGCYIINFWANGKSKFMECGSNPNSKTMNAIKRKDKQLCRRIEYREPEELFDLKNDYYAKHNIIHSDYKLRDNLRNVMYQYANKSKDIMTLNYLRTKKSYKLI